MIFTHLSNPASGELTPVSPLLSQDLSFFTRCPCSHSCHWDCLCSVRGSLVHRRVKCHVSVLSLVALYFKPDSALKPRRGPPQRFLFGCSAISCCDLAQLAALPTCVCMGAAAWPDTACLLSLSVVAINHSRLQPIYQAQMAFAQVMWAYERSRSPSTSTTWCSWVG